MIKYGYTASFQRQMKDYPNLLPARVLAVHRESCRLATPEGERDGKLKASAFLNAPVYPAVGDWTAAEIVDGRLALVHAVLERKSFFSRKNPAVNDGPDIEQAVAANFDLVCVCTSLNHDFNIPRLERFLSLAWQSGAVPMITLTKADLIDDPAPLIRQTERAFPGVFVSAVSSHTGQGMDIFKTVPKPGQTIVLLGSSGTGKSSIVNALLGEERMKISGIREDDSKGRHTTTHRELIMLPDGVMLIDTPGMRTVGMLDNAEGLSETFADIDSMRCRFSDCSHNNEPGCAVRAAIADGTLDPGRFERYRRLQRELRHLERKDSFQQMRMAKQRNKSISKQIKDHYNQSEKYI